MIPVLLFFDDGYREDLKMCKLLKEKNLTATFSIMLQNVGIELSKEDLEELSDIGEIAAHSITHPNLSKLIDVDCRRAWDEVSYPRKRLEELIGRPITAFTYPYGIYNERVVKFVKDAGYYCARTLDHFNLHFDNDRYRLSVTIGDYTPSWRLHFKGFINGRANAVFFKSLFLSSNKTYVTNFISLARDVLDGLAKSQKNNRCFSLLIHSKQLVKQGLVGKFEELLSYLCRNRNIFETVRITEYARLLERSKAYMPSDAPREA